jgi:hypothetical protein
MFVMVSPLLAHLGETLTSLKFATKVRLYSLPIYFPPFRGRKYRGLQSGMLMIDLCRCIIRILVLPGRPRRSRTEVDRSRELQLVPYFVPVLRRLYLRSLWVALDWIERAWPWSRMRFVPFYSVATLGFESC